jgi:hypothetical protein
MPICQAVSVKFSWTKPAKVWLDNAGGGGAQYATEALWTSSPDQTSE